MKKILKFNYFLSIFLLALLPLLNGRKGDSVFVILGIIIILLGILKKNKILLYYDISSKKIFISGIIYIICLFLLFIIHSKDISGMMRILQFIFCLATMVYFTNVDHPENILSLLKKVSYFLICTSFVLCFLKGVPKVYYSYYSHFNTLGTIMMLCLMIIFIANEKNIYKNSKKLELLMILMGMFVLFESTNRSALISVVIFYFILLLGKLFKNSNKLYVYIFLGVVIFIAGFTILYPVSYGTPIGNKLELISREYFNKNFYSGRQIIWNQILNAVKNDKVFGLGLGMVPEKLYNTSFSSHNLYLQTYLQGGLVNVFALFVFIKNIFMLFINNEKNNQISNIGFIIAIVFHECYEVTLLQNQMNIALIYWMIVGLLINLQCVKENKGERKC